MSSLASWFRNFNILVFKINKLPELETKVEQLQKYHDEKIVRLGVMDTIEKSLSEELESVKQNLIDHRKYTLETVVPKLSFIEKELSTNSGKSIKDLINKIVDGIDNVEKLSASLEYQVKKIEARQWNVMINNQSEPMFETDAIGHCTRANKSYLDFVGMQMDDVKDLGWVNVIFLDDRKLVQHEWEGAVEDRRVFDLKYRVQNATTGRVFTVRCITQPVFVDKELVGYIGRFINIVEMVQDPMTGLWTKKPA
jgi:PAS domain S-box-containing protein